MKVKILKEIFNIIPDDYEVCIDDADTAWFLDIVDISRSDITKFVCLRGHYKEKDQFCENRSGMKEIFSKEYKNGI